MFALDFDLHGPNKKNSSNPSTGEIHVVACHAQRIQTCWNKNWMPTIKEDKYSGEAS